MIRTICIGAVAALLLVAARPASAQDLTAGYQYQRLVDSGDAVNVPMGFAIDGSVPISGSLSAVGQFDLSRKTESASESVFGSSYEASMTLATFGAGLRWTAPRSGARPFLQLLVGVGTMTASLDCKVEGVSCKDLLGDLSASETKGMVQAGGGVSVPLSTRLRGVAQADYRRIFSTDGTNSLRLFGGLRFGFK